MTHPNDWEPTDADWEDIAYILDKRKEHPYAELIVSNGWFNKLKPIKAPFQLLQHNSDQDLSD